MKKFTKVAAVIGGIFIIALIVLYVSGNWGRLGNSLVNGVTKTVTGKDSNFDGFTSGTAKDAEINWGN